MDQLQLREKEIFNTLKEINDLEFVVIGGYAVNAYTLPRFSVDCDIVVKSESELKEIEKRLIGLGYIKEIFGTATVPYAGRFERYTKKIKDDFKVSMDILIKDVFDRQTQAVFTSDWVFSNAQKNILRGKTIKEELKVPIINRDALVVMKMICCRSTDIRDVFMLAPEISNKEWIGQEISKRYNFNNRFSKILEKINSEQFKDGLQGVFGFIASGL